MVIRSVKAIKFFMKKKKKNHELLFVIMVKKSTEGKFTNKQFRMFKHREEGRKQIKENSVYLNALLTIRSFNKY